MAELSDETTKKLNDRLKQVTDSNEGLKDKIQQNSSVLIKLIQKINDQTKDDKKRDKLQLEKDLKGQDETDLTTLTKNLSQSLNIGDFSKILSTNFD